MNMKQTIFIAAFALAFFSGIYWCISLCVDTKHMYEVSYASGRYTYSDYTDTFTLAPTSIRYKDERGRDVIRYGTFSITQNPDYKK